MCFCRYKNLLPSDRRELTQLFFCFMVESKTRKSKYLNLRLTEDEHARLKELAQNYPTLSSFVLDACWHFNNKRHINTLDLFEEKFNLMKRMFTEINRSGSNLNQLIQYTNHCMIMGIYQDNTADEILRLQKEHLDCIKALKIELKIIEKEFKKNVKLY